MGRLWLGFDIASTMRCRPELQPAFGVFRGAGQQEKGPENRGFPPFAIKSSSAPQALERSDPKAPQAKFFFSFRLKTLLCITFFFWSDRCFRHLLFRESGVFRGLSCLIFLYNHY